jgi:hypothetical protein
MSEAAKVLSTVFSAGAVLSLIVALIPISWGEIRGRWIINGLAGAVMFSMAGLVVNAVNREQMAGAQPPAAVVIIERTVPQKGGPDASQTDGIRKERDTKAEWDRARETAKASNSRMISEDFIRVAVRVVVILALLFVLSTLIVCVPVALRARRARRAEAAERIRAATDPVAIARTHAPEMIEAMTLAVERIGRLDTLMAEPLDQEDAEALLMVRKRLPVVMNRLSTAMAAAGDDGERSELARIALRSVADIGHMANEARGRLADGLRAQLDTEARYIAQRTGRGIRDLTAQ